MFKYSLEKGSKKHLCPNCNKKKLVLYVDNENGNFLSPKVGRCDREINCGYHFTPKLFFQDKNQPYLPLSNKLKVTHPNKTSYHSKHEFLESLADYDKNNFVQFLNSKFDTEKVSNLIKEYKIGTSAHWYDGTIFWQIDNENKIRGGKIIMYNKTGKRTKYINWVHALTIKKEIIKTFNLKQCLFGEHLLSKYNKPIAIVESEKTVCIMSMLFEKYLWLATGSLQGLNEEKIKALKSRKIILYPDLGMEGKNGSPFDRWNSISDGLRAKGFDIQTSTLLEDKGTETERKNGFDIADFFLKNLEQKPTRIISKANKDMLKMYMKNKHFKTLTEVFNLTDINGNTIRFE